MTDDAFDSEDEDEYEPTEEDLAAARRMTELAERYPTFLLLFKALTRHKRHRRLVDLGAPQQILDKETELRERALDALADAFPYDTEVNCYNFPDILNTALSELSRPHTKGGADA
jgi:hypothetical protein